MNELILCVLCSSTAEQHAYVKLDYIWVFSTK